MAFRSLESDIDWIQNGDSCEGALAGDTEVIRLVLPTASAITPGSYLTFSMPSGDHYIWFIIDSVGTDPGLPGTGQSVNLNTASGDQLNTLIFASFAFTNVSSEVEIFVFSDLTVEVRVLSLGFVSGFQDGPGVPVGLTSLNITYDEQNGIPNKALGQIFDNTLDIKERLDIVEPIVQANATGSFLDLPDTPSSYNGFGGDYVIVNSSENALEFGIPDGATLIGGGGGSATAFQHVVLGGGAFVSPNPPTGFDDVDSYNTLTEAWGSKASRPSPPNDETSYLTAESLDGIIMTNGGRKISASGGVSTTEEYSNISNSWSTETASVKTAHSRASCTNNSDLIYHFSGYTNGALAFDNDSYNLSGKSWTVLATSSNIQAFNLASDTVGDYSYVLGGVGPSGFTVDNFSRYDHNTDSWVDFTALGGRPNIADMVFTTLNTSIRAIGGYTGSTVTSSHSVFETSTGVWSFATPFTTGARYASAGSTVGEKVYITGGTTASTGTVIKNHDQYQVDSWTVKGQFSGDGRMGCKGVAL